MKLWEKRGTGLPYPESEAAEVILAEPIREATRKERRNLLLVSFINLAIAEAQLVPKEISALGIDLERTDQSNILILLAAVTIYFLVVFIVYAASDSLAWRQKYMLAIRDHGPYISEESYHNRAIALLDKYLLFPVSLTRGFVEFILPIIIAAQNIEIA